MLQPELKMRRDKIRVQLSLEVKVREECVPEPTESFSRAFSLILNLCNPLRKNEAISSRL